SGITTFMRGLARRSRLPERALRNDAVRHQRSIQTISLAIAGWLPAKIRSGLPHFVGDLPIESSDAASACGPCPLLAQSGHGLLHALGGKTDMTVCGNSAFAVVDMRPPTQRQRTSTFNQLFDVLLFASRKW